ncbi:hypothetical protein R69608_00095 [Paraburkholderia nemoris]|nr:hypothetical protein R69608_00095 [Paraburkholderia nemoris]
MGFGFGLWGRRLRLGDVPLHSPGKPASNDMSMYCNHRPGHDHSRGCGYRRRLQLPLQLQSQWQWRPMTSHGPVARRRVKT